MSFQPENSKKLRKGICVGKQKYQLSTLWWELLWSHTGNLTFLGLPLLLLFSNEMNDAESMITFNDLHDVLSNTN